MILVGAVAIDQMDGRSILVMVFGGDKLNVASDLRRGDVDGFSLSGRRSGY